MSVQPIDYDVQIAVVELTTLVADFGIGLFGPLLLDEGDCFLDHRNRLVFCGPLSRNRRANAAGKQDRAGK
jgi:hypothetical protein